MDLKEKEKWERKKKRKIRNKTENERNGLGSAVVVVNRRQSSV